MTCSDDALIAMLRSDEGTSREESTLGHIESCSRCQNRLSELAATKNNWQRAASALSMSPFRDDEENGDAERDSSPRLARWTEASIAWDESMVRRLLDPPSHPELLGRLGRYEIERLIGSGGMGIVFKARDTELNRPVAIKILAPYLSGNGSAKKRFAREARSAAGVVDDHVVPIHNVESENEPPFLVMQYIAGGSLQEKLDRDGPLEVAEILRIGIQTAKGLATAHAQGLIHRDVKPSNILLDEGVERALLTDFGLARAENDACLTRSGFHPGTPHYMSPEQVRGESIDGRSDLFGLGCVLYALCTGHPPFRADSSYAVLRRITDDSPRSIRESNPDVPEWLELIIMKLLAKSPADRFDSAKDVAALLEDCLAHSQRPTDVPLPESLKQLQKRVRTGTPPSGFSRRARMTLAGIFSVTAALVLAAIVIVINTGKGTITIESNEKIDVPIRISQNGETVQRLTIAPGGATTRLQAGNYLIEIDAPDSSLLISKGKVELQRGGEWIARITSVIVEDGVGPLEQVHISPTTKDRGTDVTPVPDTGTIDLKGPTMSVTVNGEGVDTEDDRGKTHEVERGDAEPRTDVALNPLRPAIPGKTRSGQIVISLAHEGDVIPADLVKTLELARNANSDVHVVLHCDRTLPLTRLTAALTALKEMGIENVSITDRKERAVDPTTSDEEASDVHWGKPTQGIQLRARWETLPNQTMPRILVDVRNRSKREFLFVPDAPWCSLEVDGRWFWARRTTRRGTSLAAGEDYLNAITIDLAVDHHWIDKKNGQPMRLTAGAHQMRVSLAPDQGFPSTEPVSNAIRVVIGPLPTRSLSPHDFGPRAEAADDEPNEETKAATTDAAVLADEFHKVMTQKGYSFLSSPEMRRRRDEIEAFVSRHLHRTLDANERKQIQKGIRRCIDRLYSTPAGKVYYGNGFGSGGEEWMYLCDRDLYQTFQYHLWIALTQKARTADEIRRRDEQQQWMRDHVTNMPFRGRQESVPVKGMQPGDVRPWVLDQLNQAFRDPLHLLSLPMPDSAFTKLQERFKEINNGMVSTFRDMQVAALTSRFPAQESSKGRYGHVYPGTSPFAEPVVKLGGNAPHLCFASNADFFGHHGWLSYNRNAVYDVVRCREMIPEHDHKPDSKEMAEWLNEEQRGELACDRGIVAVRGSVIAKLDVQNWFEADKLTDDQLAEIIRQHGKKKINDYSLPPVNGLHKGDRSEGEFFMVVQNPEGRLVVVNFHNDEFDTVSFWCRPRLLKTDQPARAPESESSEAISLNPHWEIKHLSHEVAATGCFLRDGSIYVGGGKQKTISKISIEDGEILWSAHSGSYQPSYPVSNGQVVVFGQIDSSQHSIMALDDRTGEIRWTIPSEDQCMAAACFSDELVFIGSYDKHLYAIDWNQGTVRWKTPLSNRIWSTPTTYDNHVLVGCYDGSLYAIEQDTGEVSWQIKCGKKIGSNPIVVNQLAFLGMDDQAFGDDLGSAKDQKHLLIIDLKKSDIIARYSTTNEWCRQPLVSGGTVYFFDDDSLFAFDTVRQQEMWKVDARSRGVLAYPILSQDSIILAMNRLGHDGEHQKRLVTFDRITGKELTFSNTGGVGIRGPHYIQHKHFVVATDYRLRCLNVTPTSSLAQTNGQSAENR